MKTLENSNYKILIVDDNQENIRTIGSVLRQNAFKVGFAENGYDALKILKQNYQEFNLILLDVNMPGMNGYEVCKEIKNDAFIREIPVIFLTANVDSEFVLQGFESGGQDYITKPFNSGEMLARIHTHIELFESRKALKNINSKLEELVLERTMELIDANKKLEQANKELSVLDNSKVEFLNLISHEINTPLNGIIGFAGILKQELISTEYFELIDILSNSAKRLHEFAKTSLLITKIRTSPEDFNMVEINLPNMIEELIYNYKDILNNKNIKINYICQSNKSIILGNHELIYKCFVNIFENSINYSPFDDSIDIKISEIEPNIVVTIRDHGTGFSIQALQNLFKPFSPGERHIDNNKGLSLSLVKLIADLHQIQIEISNESDGGAVVNLIFNNLMHE